MPDKTKTEPPRKRGLRWRRMFVALVLLGLAAAGVYLASWMNSRRYSLIVDATEVRVAKGRMLPIGHEPFVPSDIALRRAYQAFPLPSGIKIPRGETTFSDRVELDQALFNVLKDSAKFALSEDNRRTPELVATYLRQIHAIPGTSVSQQLEIAQLGRDAAYVEARLRMNEGVASFKEAARLYRESAQGQGARERDGEARARAIEATIERLDRAAAPSVPSSGSTPERAPSTLGNTRDTKTATTGTSSRAAERN